MHLDIIAGLSRKVLAAEAQYLRMKKVAGDAYPKVERLARTLEPLELPPGVEVDFEISYSGGIDLTFSNLNGFMEMVPILEALQEEYGKASRATDNYNINWRFIILPGLYIYLKLGDEPSQCKKVLVKTETKPVEEKTFRFVCPGDPEYESATHVKR